MKFLSMLLLISFCLVAVAVAAPAEREVKVQRLDNPVQRLSAAPAKDASACMLGNLNDPVYAISDWIWGGETYYTMFDAEMADCTCAEGFTVEAVHMFMQFSADDVPVSFDLYGSFHTAVFDEMTQCWIPSETVCETPFYTMTIDLPGLYDISLPVDYAVCECAAFGYKYAAGITIDTEFTSNPDLITDEAPLGCTSYNEYGNGLEDLQDYELPGEAILFVDVGCCANPVNTDATTFGGIKALFK